MHRLAQLVDYHVRAVRNPFRDFGGTMVTVPSTNTRACVLLHADLCAGRSLVPVTPPVAGLLQEHGEGTVFHDNRAEVTAWRLVQNVGPTVLAPLDSGWVSGARRTSPASPAFDKTRTPPPADPPNRCAPELCTTLLGPVCEVTVEVETVR